MPASRLCGDFLRVKLAIFLHVFGVSAYGTRWILTKTSDRAPAQLTGERVNHSNSTSVICLTEANLPFEISTARCCGFHL